MTAVFKAQWAEDSAWRRDFYFLLRLFTKWLKDNALLDADAQDRIKRLEQRARTEKLMVAMVAEYSRGKSELINAMLFAEFGRRIMPTSAGRTTMCPTEIGYEADIAPSLRLLPIQTRLHPRPLADWRMEPEAWTNIALDQNDADQIASSMERLTETTDVTAQEARALGLWQDHTPQSQWALDASGMVKIPKWRHALVNIDHPLLKQGLVILDTPGLNALGAEPELTIGLLDQAQAHLFILSADTGASKADLAIWQEHLAPRRRPSVPTMVVLNKIDTLWDELNSSDQVSRQIDAQIHRTANTLGVDPANIFAVSAQKGLVAKINHQPDLLEKSKLQELELALTHGLLVKRQRMMRESLDQGIADLKESLDQVLEARARDLQAQRLELQSLRGKSRDVMRNLSAQITREQRQFEQAGTRMAAMKSVYRTLFHNILEQLRPQELAREMETLAAALRSPWMKWDIKKIYGETFERLQSRAGTLQATTNDLQGIQTSAFKQLNSEYGFMLQPVVPPSFSSYQMDLELTKRSHLAYVGLRHALRMQRSDFVTQVVRALFHRLEALQAAARADAQQWRLSAVAQLETQTALRRAQFLSRLENIEKIERANATLEQRLNQIMESEQSLQNLRLKLSAQAAYLRAANDEVVPVRPPKEVPRLDSEKSISTELIV